MSDQKLFTILELNELDWHELMTPQ